MFKRKGGGVKGLLNNVQKNCTFLSGWLPLHRPVETVIVMQSSRVRSRVRSLTVVTIFILLLHLSKWRQQVGKQAPGTESTSSG